MATDREKLEHLLAGGVLRTVGDTLFKWLNEEDKLVVASSTGMANASYSGFLDVEKMESYIEPEWWDNIPPEGVVCKVWDVGEAFDVDIKIVSIANYNISYSAQGFSDKEGRGWDNAIPLNEEQLAAYELLKVIGT